ncbi:hypothetical protein MYX82_03325 [Acidobacteria bacterium AH-259-D05]|nr:hypothetical protein [Acidobacteria bacterium AH-259-D05]
MLSKQQVKDLVRESLIMLNEEKKEDQKIPVADDTALLGSGTLLDSVDFIVIVINIEERLQALTGHEIQLTADLRLLHEDSPSLTVAVLSEHIVTILQTEQSGD